jgi:hypothetical protein
MDPTMPPNESGLNREAGDGGSGGEDDELLDDNAVANELTNAGYVRDHDCPGTTGWKNRGGHLFYVPKPCTRKTLRERLARFRTPPNDP